MISIHNRKFPKGYTRLQYKKYIQSEEWKKKRDFVLKLRNYRCEVCGSTKCLSVHHLTYKHIENERIEELAVLCRACHYTSHNMSWKTSLPSPAVIKIILAIRSGIISKRMKSRIKLFFRRRRILLLHRSTTRRRPFEFFSLCANK